MNEYIVKSHLGGYYTSLANEEDIVKICDDCGCSDSIILSWNKGDDEGMIKEVKDKITSHYFTNSLELKNYLLNLYECFFYNERGFIKILKRFNESRLNNYYDVENFIIELCKCDVINNEVRNDLMIFNYETYNNEKSLTSNINAAYLDTIKKIRKKRIKIKKMILKRQDMC